MSVDIINEIKSLHTNMIKKLFNMQKIDTKNRPKPLQVAIIDFLLENEAKSIYQKDLEIKFNISKSAISDVLSTMENNDMISRITEKDDARKRKIILTEHAKEIHKEMIKVKVQANKEILEGISNEEIEKFIIIAEKLKNNMKKEGK